MALDEDACAICEGDRSTAKNPIMFCDGKGCNVPVHKDCYGVDDIPEGEWYCQRCEARRNGKPARIVCCPQQTGAFKTTVKPGNFIHIACAKWNKDIHHDAEPYNIDDVKMDHYKCFQCDKAKGICIKCQHDACDKWVHCTCAINTGLITVTKKVPESYSPRCNEHQPEDVINKRMFRRYGDISLPTKKRKKLLKRNAMESSTESEPEEEDEDQDDDNDDDHEEEEEDEEDDEDEDKEEEEEEDSDDDMGTTTRKKRTTNKKTVDKKTPIKKRRATAPHGKKGGLNQLFMSDQSDSEEDMGRRNNNNSNKSRKNNNNINSTTMSLSSPPLAATTTSTTKPGGMLGLIEAKRKKSQKLSLQPPPSSSQIPTPITITAPILSALPTPTTTTIPSNNVLSSSSPALVPTSTFPSGMATPTSVPQSSLIQNKPTPNPLLHKQKLPNKAHLMPNQASNNGMKKASPVFQDLDEIQSNMLGQRRTPATALTNTQNNNNNPPTSSTTTNHTSNIPSSSPFDNTPMNGERRNTMPDRKPSSLFQQGLPPQQQRRSTMENPNDINEFQRTMIRSKISEIMDEVLSQPLQKSPSNNNNDTDILRQEIMRLREENRRLHTFKRSVAEVFEGLNTKVPSGLPASVDRIEDYVNELRMMFVRNGALREQDHQRITQYVQDMIIDRL